MRAAGLMALLVLNGLLVADASHARTRFGVEGGARIARLTRENAFLPLETEYETGWAAGAVAQRDLGGRFAMVTGLRYTHAFEDYSFTITSSSGPMEEIRFDFRDTFHALEVPLRIEWRPRGPGVLLGSVVLEGGVSAGYLLEAWTTAEARGGLFFEPKPGVPADNVITFREEETGRYRRWSLSTAFGMGWDIPMGPGLGTLRFRYAHGLTDWTEGAERYPRAFEIEAGWRR